MNNGKGSMVNGQLTIENGQWRLVVQEANGRKNILPILRAWKVKAGVRAETGIKTTNENQAGGGSLVGDTKATLEIGLWNIMMNRSIRIGYWCTCFGD
ncbi:MAG: hypothetical protein IPI50_08775 [Saprospiraceae bacterium]|nr:hypothetical protein [Saprospiraceae bacterium]